MKLPDIVGEPAEGDPQGIREVAATHTGVARGLHARAATARSALIPLESATAHVVDSIRTSTMLTAEKFERAAAAHEQLASILIDYAAELDHLQAAARTLLGRAQGEYEDIWMHRSRALNAPSEAVVGWALAWDEVLPVGMYLSQSAYLHRWQHAIDDYRSTAARFNVLFAERERLDADTARKLRSVDLVSELFGASQRGSADGRLTAAALWAGDLYGVTAAGLAGLEGADRVREAWSGLSDGQRAALIAGSPKIIGNLDGVSLLDRVEANRRNVSNEIGLRQRTIADLRAMLDDPDAWSAKHPRDVASGKAEILARIAAEQRAIDGFRALLDQRVTWYSQDGTEHTDIGARIVVFDPARSAIATYHGAIDTETRDVPAWLRNVAVFVPGTGTQMDDFSDERGRDLARAAGRDSAMFVWAGGLFPQGGEAVNASFSRDLAPKLLSFVEGIAMPSDASVTMIGHSYGSAIVGIAEAKGLPADRVLYVAGAGIGLGNTSVEAFPNGADHYAIMARRDFIVGSSQGVYREDWGLGHGPSPLADHAITRLETGWVVAGDPASGGLDDYDNPDSLTAAGIDSHNSVFKLGSTAFDNIVGVIVGGPVEQFAPDEVRMVGGTTVSIDGINRDGYSPTKVTVR